MTWSGGWIAVQLVLTGRRWHLPTWLNMSFVAAAFVGLAIQWGFSFFASRQSRRLNSRTEADLHKVQDLLETVRQSVARVNAVSLQLREEMVEFTSAALNRDQSSPAGPPAVPVLTAAAGGGLDDRDFELPDRVRDLVAAKGVEGLSMRQVYDLVRPSTLEALLYALYRLRDDNDVTWEGSRISWDTRVNVPRWLNGPSSQTGP